MSTGSRPVLLILSTILFLFACAPEKASPPFTFPHHAIKLHYDPITHELTAVDSVSIQYDKNVDRIHFFLHKALQVERVSVGHQEFLIGDLNDIEIDRMYQSLSDESRALVKEAQIVVVHLPKSLYSERIQVRYKGKIDLTVNQPSAWYPIVPDTMASLELTTLIPNTHKMLSSAQQHFEDQDDAWRFNRFAAALSRSCCTIQVVELK